MAGSCFCVLCRAAPRRLGLFDVGAAGQLLRWRGLFPLRDVRPRLKISPSISIAKLSGCGGFGLWKPIKSEGSES